MMRNLVLLMGLLIPTQNLGSQEIPTGRTYIELNGNSNVKALELLKAGGFAAKETAKPKYSIPNIIVGGYSGPVEYGELVMLIAEYDEDHPPEGLVGMFFNWTVIDQGKKKRVFGEGTPQIAFAAGLTPRTITVVLDVNCDFQTTQVIKVVGEDGKPADKKIIVDAKGLSPSPIITEIKIGLEPTPPPSPTPTPPTPLPPAPLPNPVFPEGEFGLSKFIYDVFTTDTNLDLNSKVLLANKLAEGLEGIAAKVAAISSYKDVPTILADTTKANTSAFASLPIDLKKTESIKLLIQKKISELWKSSKINNAENIASAWRELSVGLRSIQ